MNNLKTTLIALSCLVLFVVPVRSQAVPRKSTNGTEVAMAATSAPPVSDTMTRVPALRSMMALDPTRRIVVSLEDRRLALVEDGVVKKVYRVAVGREDSPSPTGTFMIVNRVQNPTYYHQGEVIPPGPENPVGTRWIGLDRKGYGIHGTNMPHSIGKAASHGCIRMRRRDLEDLFAQVRGGDLVEIIGERNDETAAIFGEPALPGTATPAQIVTVQTAIENPSQPTAADPAAAVMPAMVPASR
jgi:lipoprotein-anchoring transpeptidase ErfK/SrfK